MRESLHNYMQVGIVHFMAYPQTLTGEGKRPIVAFELKPLVGESSEMVIAGARRTSVEAWSRLEGGATDGVRRRELPRPIRCGKRGPSLSNGVQVQPSKNLLKDKEARFELVLNP